MKKSYIEIWGDMIYIKDLVISITLISITTMGAHLLAPENNRPLGLLFGLLGAVIGFFIAMVLIKPKRNVVMMDKDHD
jgi:hypothetical protein